MILLLEIKIQGFVVECCQIKFLIFKYFFMLERDSEQRNMSLWERSGGSNMSISSMLQNSIYQVASSRKFITFKSS